MISESERCQGLVIREIVVHKTSAYVKVMNVSGRLDAFYVDGGAFQVKHSTKRLSPWQFTYFPDNLAELAELQRQFTCVWVFLVCGQDGIVGLALSELWSIIQLGETGAAWVKVRRNRNSMYRVSGGRGELDRAKPRGVQGFLADLATIGASSSLQLGLDGC